MVTIGNLIKSRASLTPDLEAVVCENRRIGYRDYNIMINQLADYLLERNIQKGDRIALLCHNHSSFPLIYLAAAKIGAITVPLNWRAKPDEIRWMLEDCEPKILFYDDLFRPFLSSLEDLSFLETTIPVGDSEETNRFFENLFLHRRDQEPDRTVRSHDPALIIYTSGTTGKPKGVVCTHQNVYTAGLGNVNTLDLWMGDRFLFVTPLFHISGMMFIINAIIRGFTLVLNPRFDPVHIWDLIEQEKITGMMSVPSMLSFMLETVKTRNQVASSLRSILSGGSLVPEKLIRDFYELGYPVSQVYGATEYTGAITYWMPHMDIQRCDSVGKGLYLTEIKVIDPISGNGLPPGEIGEILCRGPQIFAGYWNRKEESDQVLKNGWYHTRDVGKLDSDGYLYVIDRLRDMIIVSGEKVFPAQVEAIINQLEEVEEVAVVGVQHDVWGELSKAYVVKKDTASSLSESEIIQHTRRQLADYNLHEVEFVKELPKNGMGKVLKYLLREYANQSAS
ncbi:long-chain fatty acid--CoA ligase [Kroppenstedtia pulmonis]|uniref:Long-chain fatty acid--CoA ligase n=1 Tax=Kroppenstedtia pulmonis TaxID=1380685 RepID=A0A7D3Y340_9BACL|nr:AMP-binding protein [Kroppenstedtia pulmonis]QKG85303.1 long-chain fatty acid--CoA ligase [Kroppenstedtia pulmonis]